ADTWREAGCKPVSSRTGEIQSLLEQWEADNRDIEYSNQTPIHPARLVKEVRPFVDENTILVSDASSPFMWASSHVKVHAGTTFISPRGTGAISNSLPLPPGAKRATPVTYGTCDARDDTVRDVVV